MSKRRTHSLEFKARFDMEAISGRKTIQEIAADHAIHPIQVSQRPSNSAVPTPLRSTCVTPVMTSGWKLALIGVAKRNGD
jgi:hypothetical protein